MSRSRKPVNPAAEKSYMQLKLETSAAILLSDYQYPYKDGHTSADNGRVGGQMVRKMIEAQEQKYAGSSSPSQSQSTGTTLTAKYDANKQP